MRISHLHFENWRNFQQVDVSLQDRAFLVGPNASGKSNFLDALRFLRDLVSPGGGFEKAVQSRGGVSRLRSLSARRQPEIAIQVTLQDNAAPEWTYYLSFVQDNQRRPVIAAERVLKGSERLLDRPNKEDQDDPERLRQTHLEQVNANRAFREIVDFFVSIRYYHIVPQLIREPDRSAGRQADPYGGDFLEQIARTPAKTRDARLRRIREALGVAIPQLVDLKLDRDERGVPHLLGRYQHWRQGAGWQNEADFSDGALRLLGLLWALLDGNGPLLLEEPELSLHPDVVQYIPQMLARVQQRRGRQIILSTHSADLLRDPGISADEVLIFTPSSDGTKVETGAMIQEVKHLLETGLSMTDVVIPRTHPTNVAQLPLFAE